MVAIQKDFASKGVQLVAINSNDENAYAEDSFPEMVKRAANKHFNFVYARDADQKVVDAYGGDQLTILTFAAEPPVVAPGGRVLLCYGVNNATMVKIEPDAPPIKPAVTHCLEVHPKKTTRYTLTAEDAKGNRKEQGLTIQVRPVTPATDSPAP
jgi:hypothetical protein